MTLIGANCTKKEIPTLIPTQYGLLGTNGPLVVGVAKKNVLTLQLS